MAILRPSWKQIGNWIRHRIWNTKIKVKNATGTTDDSRNWLEYYYGGPLNIPSSYTCPSCGKTMYRKKDISQNPSFDDKDVMVGGHVTSFWGEAILPMCKECNDKKENLESFWARLGDLKRVPSK